MSKSESRLFKVEFKSTDAPALTDSMKEWLENFWKDDTRYFTISLDDLNSWRSDNKIPKNVRPLVDWLIIYLTQESEHCVSFEIL